MVAISLGFVPTAVVRSVPSGCKVGSSFEVGPETVEVISHQVQPMAEATRTAPQAKVEHFLIWVAKDLVAESMPTNSLALGTLAYTREFSRNPLGGQAGFGEGATVTPRRFFATFFFAAGFWVALAAGLREVLTDIPSAGEVDEIATAEVRTMALAMRTGSARDLAL